MIFRFSHLESLILISVIFVRGGNLDWQIMFMSYRLHYFVQLIQLIFCEESQILILNVQLCYTTKVLKEKLFNKLHIPLERQSIVYSGKWLKGKLQHPKGCYCPHGFSPLLRILTYCILFCFLILRTWLNLNFELRIIFCQAAVLDVCSLPDFSCRTPK